MKKIGRAGSTFGTVVAAAVVIAVASTGGAVAGGLITSKQIKNNTIKSIDVRDGNLKGIDVTDGSLTGADIATASIPKADLAAAARGFTSIVTEVESAAIAGNGNTTRNVVCPAGTVAIGGGGYVQPTGIVLIGGSSGTLVRSLPSNPGTSPLFINFPAGDNNAPRSWRTSLHNDSGDASTAFHYAMCASK